MMLRRSRDGGSKPRKEMHFFKAYQILKGITTYDLLEDFDGMTKEEFCAEKIRACRVIVNSLYDDQTRNNDPEFGKILAGTLCALYTVYDDEDSNVWIVADESIIKLIKLFTPKYGQLFALNLTRLILGKLSIHLTSVRSLKSALSRFSEVCHFISPKYIKQMTEDNEIRDVFMRIVSKSDDALLETLSQCIELIYETFGHYFTPQQADELEDIFLILLSRQSSQTRLYGATCITALIKHYPIPRFTHIIDKLVRVEYNKMTKTADKARLSAYKHGIVLSMLRIAKIDTSKSIWDESPLKGITQTMLDFCLDCIKTSKESYILNNTLEVINYLLNNYADDDLLWDDLDAYWNELSLNMTNLTIGSGVDSSKVSSLSTSLSCLAILYRVRPQQTRKAFAEASKDYISVLRKFLSSGDPAIRGSACVLFSEIVGSTMFAQSEFEGISLSEIINELSESFKERLYLVKKSACTALGTCLNACMHYACGEEFRELSVQIVTTLLGTNAEDYWVVKVEVARILSEIDYRTLIGHSKSMFTVQDQALDFILELLESNDPKIRNPTSTYLTEMIKHLYIPTNQEKYKYLRYSKNLEYVVEKLIRSSLTMHSMAQIKGIYHAFCAIGEKYGNLNGSGPNPLCCYSCEIMPLLIERITSTSLAFDFDCHIDMLRIIDMISRGQTQYSNRFSQPVLSHLLSVLNIICFILKSKSVLPSGDLMAGDKFFTAGQENNNKFLGTFYNKQNYVDLFIRLHGNYFSNYTSTNENNLDKMSQLRAVTLHTLSTIIKNCGASIIPYGDEIMHYLKFLYPYEQKETIVCIKDFFSVFLEEKYPPKTVAKEPLYIDYDEDDFMLYWKQTQIEVPELKEKIPFFDKYGEILKMIKITYLETNDQECRGEILKLLTVLTRAGLDCALIDSQNMTLLFYALSQYIRTDPHYFPNTSVTNLRGLLCYAQEMFITRGMLGDLWTSGTLINIIELPRDETHDISWKIVFKALEDAIPMVFNAVRTDFLMYYVESIMKIAIRQLKKKAMYSPVMEFIIRILLYSKEYDMNWESFSLISLGRALDFIKNPCMKSYKDFWRLCSLWSALSPNSFEHNTWKEFICSAPEAIDEGSSHVHKEFPQGARFDNMLKGLGLLWAPGFIVAAMFGAENMGEADLMKHIRELGEEKFLENIVRSISLIIKRTVRLYHIRDLNRFVVAAIMLSTKLLRRVHGFSKEINKDFLYKECVKFCNFVHKSAIPDSIVNSLCGYIRALFSLVNDYNLLQMFFDTLEENEDYDNAFLLEELCLYISRCPKEKVPAMSQHTIEMLISSGDKNIRRAAKGLSAAQNIATTYKVAEAWAREVGTYKNAEVYHSIVSQLPRNLATFEFIVNNIGYVKVGLLCIKLEKVLIGILKRIEGSTEKEKLKALYETVLSNTSSSRFTKLKAALQEAIKNKEETLEVLSPVSPKGGRRSQNIIEQTYDKEQLVSYILRQIELCMNNNIEVVSSLFELGGTYFQDALFAGKLDSIIISFVKKRGDMRVNDLVCNYVVKILNDLENVEDESMPWEKSILVCLLIDVLDKELLMYATYDQFIGFLGRTIHNFVKRWRDSGSKIYSPPATLYDFYIIMRAIIFALFDNNNVTLDDPSIRKLVGGIYDAYSYVVLPQDLQAASVITRCLSQETDERSIAEGKLHAFLAAQITGGFADLDEFGKSFVRTLVSLEFTLARKFTGILFPLPDRSSKPEDDAGSRSMKRMMRIQDLSIYRMCQLHESPELTLRVALNFITTAGVNSVHEFYWVHKGLCSMLSDTSHDLISEELKCLALRGATSLIVNACIRDTREERIRHILDPEIYSNKRGYGLHRAKMINESIPLEEIIAMAHEEYTEVLSKPEDVHSRSASLSPQMSPQGLVPKDEAVIEMDLKRQGARNLNDLIESFFNSEYEGEGELGTKFGYDQLPLSEINKKRTFQWKGLNISVAISNFMYILENILKVEDLITREGDLQLSDLQCEAVHSLVTLSDVLVPAQSMWLFDICTQLFDLVNGTTDFLLVRNLVIGVLKSAAQTNSTSAQVVNAINRVICHSLVSEHMTVKSGTLIGVRFLLQASNRDVFLPDYLATIVMNHINETLYTVQPENTLLQVLSAGFDLIQYLPRQAEEFGFTDSFISGAVSICKDPKSSSNIVRYIYKGLRMLLLCDTIDQNKRIPIEEFALRTLKQNTIHSNLSIGLLFTSMYARKDAFSLYTSKRRSPKTDELRKFQEIFAYIKHQTPDWELQASTPKLVDILGQMMGDLLTPEVALKEVAKEFSGATEQSRRIFVRVMHKLLSLIEDKNTVFDVIRETLMNFRGKADEMRLDTCILLSVASDDMLMNNLFNIALYVKSNKEMLQFAGREALRRFSPENADDVRSIFNFYFDIKF